MKQVFIYGDKKTFKNYYNALKDLNAIPLISRNIDLCKNCDFLILPGGGDIAPCIYNSINYFNCYDVNLKRDICEIYLIYKFIKMRKPILGICRGMQILNVFFGGTMNTQIEKHWIHYNKNYDTTHPIKDTKGFIKNIYGNSYIVNSKHRQSVKDIGKGLDVCAVSKDDLVEAFENKYLKIYGVQFHPERMGKNGLELIDRFLSLK